MDAISFFPWKKLILNFKYRKRGYLWFQKIFLQIPSSKFTCSKVAAGVSTSEQRHRDCSSLFFFEQIYSSDKYFCCWNLTCMWLLRHWDYIFTWSKRNPAVTLMLKVTLKAFYDFKNKQKSVWSNVFWYVKVCILWKCSQYTIHWDKTQMLKRFSLEKINGIKNAPFFLSRALTHNSFTFNLRVLYELKHKVCLSKTVCGFFHFWFRFAFINVYVFVQQNNWFLPKLK